MSDERAISSVGTTLLIGIVVSLVVVAAYASTMLRDSIEPSNPSELEGDARLQGGDHEVALLRGSAPVDGAWFAIVADGIEVREELSWWMEGTWMPGQWICISGTAPDCRIAPADSVQVTFWQATGPGFSLGTLDSTDTSLEPIQYTGTRPSFYVDDDGGIVVQCDGDVTLQIIGTEITSGAGGPDIPVYVQVTSTGGPPYADPFGTAVAAGMSHPMDTLEGAILGIHGRATGHGFDEAYTSFDDDPHVLTLVNGDQGPSFQPFGNQIGIGPLLAPYVDGNGHIVLADNETIILFEFNPSLQSAAADFQDLVVLFRFDQSSC